MCDCRLIIFEGLMGFGKSSMATKTAIELQERGNPYRYHWESELPHPVKIRPRLGPNTLSPEKQIERSLLKWRAFVVQHPDRVTVLDGHLFHVNETIIFKQNGTREQIENYIRKDGSTWIRQLCVIGNVAKRAYPLGVDTSSPGGRPEIRKRRYQFWYRLLSCGLFLTAII